MVAQSIISALEGALLVARPYGDVDRFERAAERLMTSLVDDPSRTGAKRAKRVRRAG